MHTITAGGAAIPALGFGTYPMTGKQCRRAVSTALEVGYRHVDTWPARTCWRRPARASTGWGWSPSTSC